MSAAGQREGDGAHAIAPTPEATIATHNERRRCAQLVINFFTDAGADETQAITHPLVAAILRPEAGNQPTPALLSVIAERARQISAEGWTPGHDDQHAYGEIAAAAACYAMLSDFYDNRLPPPEWPWAPEWWKPSDNRRNCVKAAALLLAEIERIDRSAGTPDLADLPSTADAYAAMSWDASLRGTAAHGAAVPPAPTRESLMVVVSVKPDGTPDVWCDPEIADIVRALNAAGIRTVASCSGHGHRPGTILLQDGRQIVLPRDAADNAAIEALFPPDINGDPMAARAATVIESTDRRSLLEDE